MFGKGELFVCMVVFTTSVIATGLWFPKEDQPISEIFGGEESFNPDYPNIQGSQGRVSKMLKLKLAKDNTNSPPSRGPIEQWIAQLENEKRSKDLRSEARRGRYVTWRNNDKQMQEKWRRLRMGQRLASPHLMRNRTMRRHSRVQNRMSIGKEENMGSAAVKIEKDSSTVKPNTPSSINV